MKRSKKKAKAVLPVIISVGICATSVGVSVNALPQVAYASNGAQAVSANNDPAGELPPVRTSLTEQEAEQMAGCEAYFDAAKHEFVIRPKNGANEGVISYSLANKKGDFEAIRKVLIFDDTSGDVPVRFDKRVYIYGSTNASANDTLFYQAHVKTINITDNLSIKFAKDLAKFFMQNYNKAADHLHYIKGIENWDTSKIESMEKMFNLASQLEGKIDLSRWNVSNTDKLNLMFSGVGNDNFILDFSNKNFKNAADVTNMFNSFRGVLVANNWTVADPNGSSNPIQKLINSTSSILTHWNGSAYTGPSWHLLITDNPTILEKNKTEKYKFYKKVKVIYKVNGTEKSAELELPAVYDSRIDADGKPDASKAASNDPMQVVRPQIDDAIKQAVKDLRDQNPSLKLPENVIPVPVHDLKDAKSPIELFQDYYLGLVKEEVTKAKTTYTADPKLEYKKVEYDTQPQDGKKQVITGAMKDGAWDPDATSEKEITKAVDGKARVGNKEVKTEEIQPDTKYEADGTLDYKKEQPTEGTKGTKTTTTIYKVDENTGLTNTVQSSESKTTTPAKDKVIKVGNVEKKTSDIPCKKTYEGNEALTYKEQKTKTAGKNGKEEVTLTYKVDAKTGLTQEVEAKKGSCTKPVNEVVQVGNKEVIQNNDGSTTTKTYKVNPDDGTLSDPTVVTARPWTNIAGGASVSEVLKAKMTYVADESLPYGQTQKVSDPKDGEKITTPTGKVENGKWVEGDPKVEIKAAVNGVTKVGNKEVKTEDIQPGVIYQADSSLAYKQEQTTEGTKGTQTTTTIYKVNPDTGLTDEVEGTPTVNTVKAKDKVIKIGNVEKKTSDIPCKKTYEGNPDLTYQKQQTKTAGQNGKEEVTLTYKVDAKTGLTTEVEAKKGLCTEPVNEVVQVGNKEVIQNNDGSTTTKIYKVNPNDGTLSDPKVVTSRPWTDIAGGASVSEVLKAKMTYVADESLPYGQTQKESDPKDGEKITTPTGKVENGKWVEGEPQVEIKAAVNGVTKVGNKKVETEEIQPDTKYEADGSLAYKQEQTTEGAKGTKTTTTIYKVDENTGLTNTVQSSESKTTTPAKDKVIKVGNVKTETEVIKFKTTYVADDTLAYEAKEDKTAGKDGSKAVTTTYKVDKTNGLSADVESTQEKKVDPIDHVVRVGNKQVTHEGDKTITTTTYDVDPNTGKLTNPKKHTSMPWGNVTPADQLQKTVTFKNSDDSQITSVKVETGKAIATDNLPDQSMPANPTKDGFKFKEWNTKQDGTGAKFNADTVVNNDLTVYAIYTKNPVTPPQPKPPVQNQKTVTFNKKDGSLLSTVKVETGKKVAAASMPAAPDEDGFTFKEWNTKQDGTGTTFNADTVVNNDLTVYAVYTKNPVTPPAPQPQPQPGQHDNSEPAVLDTQDAEVLPGKMKYEADETLPYNTQKKIKDPVDGLKITTHTGKFVNGKWEPSEKVTTTPAQNGLTKVGNKQVTHEGDKTITITYDVDPDTGKLTNPKKHISMPQTVLEAASPTPTTTNEPSESTTSEKSGRAGGHIVAKTGETPSFANMLAGIGLAIAGLITGLHKKKREDK